MPPPSPPLLFSPALSPPQAVEHSKKGVVELKQAETYQKSARPIMCMGILMVLIIIMVIGEPEGRVEGEAGHAASHPPSLPLQSSSCKRRRGPEATGQARPPNLSVGRLYQFGGRFKEGKARVALR